MDARWRVAAARAAAAARVRTAGACLSLLGRHLGNGGDHGAPAELRTLPGRSRGAFRRATASAGSSSTAISSATPSSFPAGPYFSARRASKAVRPCKRLRCDSSAFSWGPRSPMSCCGRGSDTGPSAGPSESSPAASRSDSGSSSPASRRSATARSRSARRALPGAADHIMLPVSHMGMLVSARVARETGAFLRDGRFSLR